MGYGSRARRVPALGGARLSDVDIFKLGIIMKSERGFDGVIQKEIYSMNDFYPKCGGFNQNYFGAYVVQSFFDELLNDISCEVKVISPVASDAVQAVYPILDQAASPVKIFDIKSGRRNENDLSAFGNKIGIKIAHIDEITMKITSVDIDVDSGYATISNSGSAGKFVGTIVPALTSATYDLDITVDGTIRKTATALLDTDSWAGICAKIQTALRALTSSTETVEVEGGCIRVTSHTTGSSSKIVIAAGTTGSGGGDLLAAIDAKTGYDTTLPTPVDGDTTTSSTFIDGGATECYLNNVDNLAVGNYIEFTEGTITEVKKILTITPATKKVTFSALATVDGFTIAGTTVSRQDWKLDIYVKDDLGNYQKKETWEGPFAQSNTIGVANDVNNVDSGSDFVLLAVNASNTSDADEQRPAELNVITPLTGGSDGTAAIDSDWLDTAEDYFSSEEFTILLAPESSSTTHNSGFVDFCTDGYKGMYFAQSSNGAVRATLENLGALCRGSIKFGMLPSDKWVQVDDPTVSLGTKDIPKVGIDAAHWFNTYYMFGESKVAAGNKSEMVLKSQGKLLDSNGLVHDDAEGVGGRLIRNYSVNICKYTRGKGITNNSARTFSTDRGYMYQNQIMQWILYARSIVSYLREIEQDRSGFDAQESHYNAVWAYMKKKFDAGHLFVGMLEDGSKTTFKDVCVIVNDFTINTLVNINNGIEETFLQFVAPPPIEEAILSLASAGVTTVRG
jgi:hypothetical protein